MWPHTWNLKKRTREKPNRNRARGYGEPQVGCRSRFGVDETGEGVETGFCPKSVRPGNVMCSVMTWLITLYRMFKSC